MNDLTLSRINLNCVFRVLEQLPELDTQTQALIADVDETIQFSSPAIAVRLAISGGKITHHSGPGPNSMHLVFPSAKAVNKMFDGTGMPIPIKGFRKIKFLTGNFTEVTDRLTYYLRPNEEELTDAHFRLTNSILTFRLAVYALAEIGNWDERGQVSASNMPDGEIQVSVTGQVELIVRVKNHKLRVVEGVSAQPRAKMIFADIETAGQVLRGELPSFAAIGESLIQLSGYIPLLDNLNRLLGIVPQYLR